jgi:hypothetical protein
LDTYSSRMRFFSIVLPETEDDTPDIGIGRKGAHDWCCAGGSVVFLFDGATKAAEVVGGIALVGCLIDCLGFDLFLMTKELCSLLLSPFLNKVHSEGKDASPEEEMAELILARQDGYQRYYQDSVF